eukprot:TRINITY_DN11504_c0_g1_i1.p1 TRINITY_DN11504_c0_g1~~TRINITY_DN11504_c0_g1_i1.p1  ORF type:complete len:303 (+),score=43.39 TRINITY_DN11504_c0_g1_i1:13-921(+)
MDTVIPLIDLHLSPEALAPVVNEACKSHGFFYIKNHNVDPDLMQDIFSVAKSFFSLDLEEKLKVKVDEKFRGFDACTKDSNPNWKDLPPSKIKNKESYFIGREVAPSSEESKLDFCGLNQWPNESLSPGFRDTSSRYFYSMWEVGLRVMRVVALSLGLNAKYFEEQQVFVKPYLLLRLIHYFGIVDPDKCAADPHTDYGMITLLLTDGTPGLQIEKDGEWVDIPYIPGTFVVNLGDMLQVVTNGLYKSTNHRVVLKEAKPRFSAAFFFEPNQNCLLKAIGSNDAGIKYSDHCMKKHLESQND